MESLIKIVVIGPESSGKSTLCEQLAAHYQTLWCPEYARSYLTEQGPAYTYDDLLAIARGQLELEDRIAEQVLQRHVSANVSALPKLIIDTDMYVMKVWGEYVFNNCHPWILDQIATRTYHLYLLCKPDIEWVEDALREYPDQAIRDRLYCYYKDIVVSQSIPWVELSGDYDRRLQMAIAAVDSLR